MPGEMRDPSEAHRGSPLSTAGRQQGDAYQRAPARHLSKRRTVPESQPFHRRDRSKKAAIAGAEEHRQVDKRQLCFGTFLCAQDAAKTDRLGFHPTMMANVRA